jgi:hypothetical protein
LREETSISSVQLLAEAPRWLAYDFPPEVRARLSSYWGQYKGQAQRWFLFQFTGDDSGGALVATSYYMNLQMLSASSKQLLAQLITCVRHAAHGIGSPARMLAGTLCAGLSCSSCQWLRGIIMHRDCM